MKFRFNFEGHKQLEEFNERKNELYEIVTNTKKYKNAKSLSKAIQNYFVKTLLDRLDNNVDKVSDQFNRYAKLEEELVDFLKSNNDTFNPAIKNIDIDKLRLLKDVTNKNKDVNTVFNDEYIKALSKLPSDKFKHFITVYNNDINYRSNCYIYNNTRNKLIISQLKEAQSKRGIFRKIADYFSGRKKEEDNIIKEMEDKIKDDEESITTNGVIRFKDDNLDLNNKLNKEFEEKQTLNIPKKKEVVYNKAFSLDKNYLFDTNEMGKAAEDLMESGRIYFSSYEPQTVEHYFELLGRLGKVFEKYNRVMFKMEEKGYDKKTHDSYKAFLTKACQALCVEEKSIPGLLDGKEDPKNFIERHSNCTKWFNDLNNAKEYLDEHVPQSFRK